jgi:hypothetical protein
LAAFQAFNFQTLILAFYPMDTKAQIQELISLGKTEEALELLSQLSTDAVLLQSRFNGAKRQYSMGLIDFSEWSRTQAQINYAALEMMNMVKGENKRSISADAGTFTVNLGDISAGKNDSNKRVPKVFITYSPEADGDQEAAEKMKAFLENEKINVITNEDMNLGADIQAFVNETLKKSDFILAVISRQSLQSSWESGEAALGIVLERASENKVIPVSLDKSVLDPDFYFESIDLLNEKIKKYQGYMKRTIEMGEDSRAFQNDLNRLLNAKNQLSQIIEKMKSVRMVSMGNSNEFSEKDFSNGMNKIVQRILNNQN